MRRLPTIEEAKKSSWQGTRAASAVAKETIKQLSLKKNPKTGEYSKTGDHTSDFFMSPIGGGEWEVSYKPESEDYQVYLKVVDTHGSI